MSLRRVLNLVSDGLGVILIIRLLVFRLHRVYKVFCAFVAWDLLSSGITYFEAALRSPILDYRVTWILVRGVAWVLSLWMVYVLLDAILEKYPSFRRFSRTFLNWTFVVAFVLAGISARTEYLAGSNNPHPMSLLGKLLKISLITERSISTAASLVLVLTLAFLLWFPVQMPRNLAVFSVGFIVYFSAETGLLLGGSLTNARTFGMISDLFAVALILCYGYWILLIKPSGESVPTTLGHGWNSSEQERLMRELEAMNNVLARSARN